MVDISTEKPFWTEGIQFKVYVIAVSSFIESYREVYHRFLTHLIKISIPIFVGNNKVHIITHVLFDNSEKKIRLRERKRKRRRLRTKRAPVFSNDQ